jgi:hypothetical protein
MKVLKYGLLALVLLLVVSMLAGLLMSPEWKVERTVTIHAKPGAIHALVANLRNWPKWQPWMEEGLKKPIEYEGADAAVGSKMTWSSSSNGEGSLTLTKSDPAHGLEYTTMMAEFTEPGIGSIAFTPEGDSTRVTWIDSGSMGKNPLAKLFKPVMEKMMSKYFDKGLGNLKALAEAKG